MNLGASRIGSICNKHPELKGERDMTHHCRACTREKAVAWIARNRDKYSKTQKKSYHVNQAKIIAYRAKKKEWMAAYQRAWNAANPERRYNYTKTWAAKNIVRWRALRLNNQTVRDRLVGSQQLAKTYKKEIQKIYENCPTGHHVDHIVPLRGKSVNGLHVPWNLQYLPILENQRKGNREQLR